MAHLIKVLETEWNEVGVAEAGAARVLESQHPYPLLVSRKLTPRPAGLPPAPRLGQVSKYPPLAVLTWRRRGESKTVAKFAVKKTSISVPLDDKI